MRLKIKSIVFDNKILLSIQMLISSLMIWFTINAQSSITSILFASSFVFLVLLYLSSYKKDNITLIGWILILWCAFSILISYLLSNQPFAIADLISFFTFVATILFMQSVSHIEATKKIVHLIMFFGIASSSLYPIGYYFFSANHYRLMGSLLLTMHFSSPNLTGVHLAQACIFSALGLFLLKKTWMRALSAVIFGFDLYFLFLSGARNGMITVLLVLSGMLATKMYKIKKIKLWICFAVSIAPFLFSIAYLMFIDIIGARGTLDFIIEEGKPITSRVKIWQNVFNTLKGSHWILGDFCRLRGNLHNTHITILGSYGFVGLGLMIKFLNDIMAHSNSMICSSSQTLCMIAFFGTIFMGNGEAALFYGSLGMYVIACSYLILLRYDWDNDRLLNENKLAMEETA